MGFGLLHILPADYPIFRFLLPSCSFHISQVHLSLVITDRKSDFVKVYGIFEAPLNLRNPISHNLQNTGANSFQSPCYLLNYEERATSLHNGNKVYPVD